jgi:ABC-type polysaccharide/polyol phosphate export permease
VFTLLGSLRKNRRLVRDFVVRDLKARYVGSSMGFFWSVIYPIVNLVVYMFVFRAVLNARWSDHQGPIEVALIMLAGIVVWGAFAETVSRSTNCLVENSNLIQKVVFPAEILPVYLAVSSLINMCIGLPVVVACVIWFTLVSPPQVEFVRAEAVLGEQGGASFVTVHLTRGAGEDVRVPYHLSGSATPGEDCAIEEGEILIPRGRLTYAIPIDAIPDTVTEGEEQLVLTLGEPTGVPLGANRTHTLTLSEAEPRARGEAAGFSRDEDVLARRGPGRDDPSYHPLGVGMPLVLLPLLFLLQIVFTTGLGYFLCTLNLFLRDTYHLVGVFVTVWMFSTPIFYPATLVEKQKSFSWVLQINPMHWLIDSYRSILLYGSWPDPWLLLRLAGVGLAVLFAGSAFFARHKRSIPDLL